MRSGEDGTEREPARAGTCGPGLRTTAKAGRRGGSIRHRTGLRGRPCASASRSHPRRESFPRDRDRPAAAEERNGAGRRRRRRFDRRRSGSPQCPRFRRHSAPGETERPVVSRFPKVPTCEQTPRPARTRRPGRRWDTRHCADAAAVLSCLAPSVRRRAQAPFPGGSREPCLPAVRSLTAWLRHGKPDTQAPENRPVPVPVPCRRRLARIGADPRS